MAGTRARARTGQARGGRRKDPKSRHVDGSAPWTKVKGQDPDRHYVLVYQNDDAMGPEYYADLGYRAETNGENGLRMRAGNSSKKGEDLIMRGHLLMSCSNEHKAKLDEKGPDGQSGQAAADEFEEIMLKRGGDDLMRGMRRERFLNVENTSTALEPE